MDDGVSGTLEKIPVLKAVGIESRKSIEQREAAKAADPIHASSVAQAASAPPVASGTRRSLRLLVCAAAWVNPDEAGRAAPLRLRLFELTTASHFTAAPAVELMADTRPPTWSGEIRDVRDVVIPPGRGVSMGWLSSGDALLGIVGDFRDEASASETRLVLKLDDSAAAAGWIIYARGTALHLFAAEKVESTAATSTADPPPVIPRLNQPGCPPETSPTTAKPHDPE
ncbi:type VI secretion system lipoprotein TssJ [Sphingomonas sp. NPDC079357]|uniref:type VI secretion system lipoprotein TssJ n=1 Tax=Sphingomonas sp. NPDC079357 TaxID=3364518 RepID=UPI00384C4B8B